MAAEKLTAQKREETGKGAARRARRAGYIPGVLYGHGQDAQPLTLPGHETFLIVKDNPNAIINLDIEGETHLVLLKEVQRHRVRREILHIDLQAVSRNEKVEVEVPVVLKGEVKSGFVANLEYFDLPVSVSPLDIPEEITLDVEGLEEGTVITAGDLKLPANVECTLDPETDVLSVTLPDEEPEEPAAEEGEADAESGDEE